MTNEIFTIGTLAKKAGVNVETIRYYQRRGLLAEPKRPFKGVRRYAERDARRVRFIKEAQKLGFSLAEIAELLSLEDGRQCRDAQEIALRKLAGIRERIESLRAMEKNLAALIESCAENTGPTPCPIIAGLIRTSV